MPRFLSHLKISLVYHCSLLPLLPKNPEDTFSLEKIAEKQRYSFKNQIYKFKNYFDYFQMYFFCEKSVMRPTNYYLKLDVREVLGIAGALGTGLVCPCDKDDIHVQLRVIFVNFSVFLDKP